MLWLALPLMLILGAAAALLAITSLEAQRRELQARVAALVEARAEIEPVRARIARARAAAVDRPPR
ncbi:MAG TPA: hypothetical protein PKA98_21605 [Acidimicrobiales bacterium]|nr:hypothetical protein [Acidimicrobiales bacterium]